MKSATDTASNEDIYEQEEELPALDIFIIWASKFNYDVWGNLTHSHR